MEWDGMEWDGMEWMDHVSGVGLSLSRLVGGFDVM